MHPKILIVDDMPLNIKLLAQVLAKQAAYTILTATSARQALEIAAEKMPQLILSDIMMPEMDGIELCVLLKQSDKTRQIPVFFISGANDMETIEKAYSAGACDYVSKPYSEAELLIKIKHHLHLIPPYTPSLSPKTSCPTFKVLVVDDNAINRRLVKAVLTDERLEVVAATGCDDSLEKMKLDRFDLILLDIEMPDKDGWETLKHYQSMPLNIPVMAITAHNDNQIHQRCLSAGFVAVMAKPFEKTSLQNKVFSLLEKR